LTSKDPFLRRVRIRNFKSIGDCDVDLGRLTVLVGRNGAGKSNFLDALRFVADSLQISLAQAVKSRGGIDAVRRRSTGHPHNFSIELEVNIADWSVATYGFEIGAQPKGGFSVNSESVRIVRGDGTVSDEFHFDHGKLVKTTLENLPPSMHDRLSLVAAAGLREFRGVYDALAAMGIYNLNPDEIKAMHSPDAGELLHRDGSNLASVVARISDDNPSVKTRICEYLNTIVPDVVGFDRIAYGPQETIEFRQQVKGAERPWKFPALNMSDGTLRTLGILVALMQLSGRKASVPLVGIEEPETALHPAAAGALIDSIREAIEHTQVILTTHSPELLDEIDPRQERILVAVADQGTTEIGPIDAVGMQAIQNHLYTAGELLRLDQLQPDLSNGRQQKSMVFDDQKGGI
jgi:predicted ATPase